MISTPIFLVGAPRSGTTLLAAMLSSHSRLDCGPETQLLNKLGRRRLAQAVTDQRWPHLATEFIESVKLAEQKVIDLFQVTKDEVFAYLDSRRPSVNAILESLTATHATRAGKPRWIEKTPNHLLYLDILRTCYPESPIIRIVRDPRDSSASMCKLPWASKSILVNCQIWAEWFEVSQPFFDTDSKSLTLSYESLVCNPENELKRVCSFIGESFEKCMLDARNAARTVSTPNEPWKTAVSEPLTTSRVFAWRNELPEDVANTATLLCYKGIQALGYDAVVKPLWMLPTHGLNWRAIEHNESDVIAVAQCGIRMVNCRIPFASPEVLVLYYPLASRRKAFSNVLKLFEMLFIRRLLGRKTYYLCTSQSGVVLGYPRLLIRWMLRLFANPLTTTTVSTHHV